MSSGLTGMFLFVPMNYPKIISQAIKKIKRVLPKTNSNTELFLKDTDYTKIIAQIEALGIDLEYYKEIYPCEEEIQDLIDSVHNDLKELEKIEDPLNAADLVYISQKVNGKQVLVCFAGDTSYGDEPDGEGYQTMQLLVHLGIWEILNKSIPWNIKKKK